MDAKAGACYYNTEGIYTLLKDNDYYIFFNVVFPSSIKDLHKTLKLKKEYNLQLISVKSFVKAAAIRDSNFLLSFLYPRGFIAKVSFKDISNNLSFSKLEKALLDVGEIVALKISAGVFVTVDFWVNRLQYGQYKDYFLLLMLLFKVIKISLSFNYRFLLHIFFLLNNIKNQ